jgi:hypothetical protein
MYSNSLPPSCVTEVAVRVDQAKAVAAVVRAIEPAVFGLDERPDTVRISRRDSDADAADETLGQSLGDLFPAVTAVLGAPQPAIFATAFEGPGLALSLPDSGKEDTRIGWIHRQVDGAGAVADKEHLLPVGAAVARAEDAALFIGAEDVAQGGDVHQVWILWVHMDAADLTGIAQAHVGPAIAGVGRSVDADSRRHIAPRAGRAGAGVDHIGVGGRHRQGADRAHLELFVGDVRPAQPGVGGLPHAAAGGAHVERVEVARHPGHGGHPAAAVGADIAELEGFEVILIDGRGTVCGAHGGGADDERENDQSGQRRQGGTRHLDHRESSRRGRFR